MSASQARLLAVTSRMNDIEFKSQQVANIKIRLADESESVARAYNTALSQQKYTFTNFTTNGQIQKLNLDSSTIGRSGYTLCGRNGVNPPSSYSAAQLHDMIESGQFYLAKKNDEGKYVEVSVSSETSLAIETDNSKFAQAEAKYNEDTAKIKKKEQKLDNEMKTLDTEHQALKTEMDSIKSLIKDNVDKSFNMFS